MDAHDDNLEMSMGRIQCMHLNRSINCVGGICSTPRLRLALIDHPPEGLQASGEQQQQHTTCRCGRYILNFHH